MENREIVYIRDRAGDRRKGVKVVCTYCGKEFAKDIRFVTDKNNFCTVECSRKFRRAKRIKVSCALCGASIEITPSRYSASKNKIFFCSRQCKDKGQRVGSPVACVVPGHYGNSYRTLCFSKHKKKCCVCGEHRIVEVHHYDGDHSNNTLDNLVPLCPTHHRYVHSKYKAVVEPSIEDYMKKFKEENNL